MWYGNLYLTSMPDLRQRNDFLSTPILKYYAFEATRRADFSVPIFILFYTSRGLSLAQVGVLEALWTVVVLGFETPTGYLGDRIGRRWSLVVGTLLSATGAIAFIFAHSFAAFAVIAVLRGIAATFKSGTQEAWLYDTLKAQADEERFAYHAGRASAIATLVHGVAALIGGALYSLDHSLPWLFEGAVVGSGAVIILTVHDSEVAASTEGQEQLSPRRALALARDRLSTRNLGILVVYTALLFGLINTLQIYVQPVSTRILGIDPIHLGFVYAVFTVVAAITAVYSGWLESHVGVQRWFTIAPMTLALTLVAVAFIPILALPAFVLARGISRASRPLFGQYINDRTLSEGRATVLSAASTVRSLATAPLNVLGGTLAGMVSLTTAMGILGGILFVGTILLVIPLTKTIDKTT